MITATLRPGAGSPIAELEGAAFERVLRAAALFHEAVLEALNVPNTGRSARGRTVYPDPSRPGQAPRKRTGWLQRNVVWEADRRAGAVKVGVTANAPYGVWLETGSRRMEKRPFLLATLDRMRPQLEAAARGERGRP